MFNTYSQNIIFSYTILNKTKVFIMSNIFEESQFPFNEAESQISEGGKSARKSNILSLNLKDKSLIYSAYMPFIKNGGLFIPTSRTFNVGDEVFILVRLLDEVERLPITAKVVWVTPDQSENRKPKGVGFQFDQADKGFAKNQIEQLLGSNINGENATFTL